MRNSSVSGQKADLCKVKFLQIPKPVRLFQPTKPRTKLPEPVKHTGNRSITHNAMQGNTVPILPNMDSTPKGIARRETRDVTWNRKPITPRIESKARNLPSMNDFCLSNPSRLCSRGSICSSEKKMRPKSFRNFWSKYPESLEAQPLVFSTDLDALSIEIVKMYNQPMISLPKLNMGPSGV